MDITPILVPHVCLHDGIPTTTSLNVAEVFGKRHDAVIRGIRELQSKCSKNFNAHNFVAVEYADPKGEKRPMYLLTRDGLTLLVMGYTGKEAMQYKLAYIEEFNRMEAELSGKQEKRTTVVSRKPLDKLVKVWAVRAAIPYQQAWTMLDSHFCLTDIKDLPLSKLQEAIAWVQARIDALPPEQPKALPAPERTFASRKEAFFAHVEEFRLRTVRDVEELSNEGSNLIDRERFGFGVYVNLSVLLAQWIRKQVDSPIPVGAFSDTTIKLIEALDEMKS